jgi:hypothetical protein
MIKKMVFVLATSATVGLTAFTLAAGTRNAEAQTAGVHIANAEFDDIFVTVTDVNSHRKIVDDRRINRNGQIDVDVLRDGNGKGKVSWVAKTAPSDPSKAKCGKGEQSGLDAGTEVKIRAASSC